MKMFLLIFLAASHAASEKLDRTYLPPPGAKFSGGVPGNIEVPFEFPKESYFTIPGQQGALSNGPLVPGDTRIEVGINRGPQIPGVNTESELITPSSKVPFDYFQKIPTTTTSYAFTQTTTHPPGDSFDTTFGPINTATGFPTTTPLVDFSTPAPGFGNFPQIVSQGHQVVPGYRPPNLFAQQSGSGLPPGIIQTPGSISASPSPGNAFVGQEGPGFIQGNLNQYQADINRPNIAGTSTSRPAFDAQTQNQNLYQHQLNQRPGVTNVSHQSTLAPSISEGTTSGFPQYDVNRDRIQVTSTPGTNIYSPPTTPGLSSSDSYERTTPRIPNSNIPQFNLPSGQQLAPQGFLPMQNQYQLNKDGKIVPNIPQGQHPGQLESVGEISQQYPSQLNQSRRPGQHSKFPTLSPSTPIPNYSQFSSTTPDVFPTTYPKGSYQSSPTYSETNGYVQPGLISRPERPQAESDRNAVILNYDNVITPEGYFAYSYDTSNGIHADESGTASDGVRANGSYSYIGDDGKVYSIVYTADENGFQPRGDHLPTPPPIPEAIKKVIEQVNREKEAGISDDGTYDEAKYGHKIFEGRRRPLKPNKISIEDSGIPDKNESQYDEIGRNQQVGPHTEFRRPSNEDTSTKYDKTIYGQDQLSGDDQSNEEKEQLISKFPMKHPISGFPSQQGDKYTSDYIAGDNNNRRQPFGKIPSRRPTLKPEEVDSLSEGDYESEYNSKIPSSRPGQLPSRRPSDKLHDIETYTRDSIIKTDDDQQSFNSNRYRPADKSTLRHPIASVSPTNDPLSNQYVSSQRDPYRQSLDGTNRQVTNNFPSSLIPGSKFDVTDSRKTNVHKQSQADEPLNGIHTDDLKSYNGNNQNHGRPQITTTFGSQTDDRHVILPGKVSSFSPNKPNFEQKPTETIFASQDDDSHLNAPNLVSGINQNIRQPISQRPRPYDHITTRPGDEQEATFIPQSEKSLGDRRLSVPGKISSFDQSANRPTFIQPDQLSYHTSTTKPNLFQEIELTSQNRSNLDNRQEFMPNKIYQSIRRPAFEQRPDQQNKYTTVKPIEEETGYEYIPPQIKFNDISKLPQQAGQNKHLFDRKENVPKLFMTSNVAHPEEYYENLEDNRKQLSHPSRPEQNTDFVNRPFPQQEYDLYNKQKEISDFTKIPNELNTYFTTGTTRLPSYQQTQTTTHPQQQLIQQFEPIRTDYKQAQNIPQRTTRPPQKGVEHFTGNNRDEVGIVSSTTSVPPKSSRFEIIQPIRPTYDEQHITNQYTPQRHDYKIVSTTKMPHHGSSRFEIETTKDYQTPTGSMYQTTYKPGVTISSNIDDEKVRPNSEIISTVRPSSQIFTEKPGKYTPEQVSSTTYRPGYYTDKIESEIPAVDAYGRPIASSNITPGFEGTTIRPGIGRQDVRIPFTKDLGARQPPVKFSNDGKDFTSREPGLIKHGRPIMSSDDQGDYSSTFSPYEGPSSTEKIIGEDFSGPKQPQRFDPERGYYY